MPETGWLHYAGNPLAPICRKRIGSYVPEDDIVRAHSMADVARRAELGEKTLFRALGKDGNPTLATMQKVLHAMGLRLSVAPLRELDVA